MIYKILLWYCIGVVITIIATTIWKTIEEGAGIEKEDIEKILTIGLLWFIIIPACILIYLPHKIIMYLRGDKEEKKELNDKELAEFEKILTEELHKGKDTIDLDTIVDLIKNKGDK